MVHNTGTHGYQRWRCHRTAVHPSCDESCEIRAWPICSPLAKWSAILFTDCSRLSLVVCCLSVRACASVRACSMQIPWVLGHWTLANNATILLVTFVLFYFNRVCSAFQVRSVRSFSYTNTSSARRKWRIRETNSLDFINPASFAT